MQEFDPSKFDTWKNTAKETRDKLLAELKTLAKERKHEPSELLSEAGRIAYAEMHAKCELVTHLKKKIGE
jgi:acyl-CoA reductase-like NAD-dependent aldehyde dehydrogenase